MTDQELAARWDRDHRLAAVISFFAGVAVVVGTALSLGVGSTVAETTFQGGKPDAFQVTLVAGVLLLTDLALLAFVVGLAYAVTSGRSFGLFATVCAVTLATTASATVHLIWGNAAPGYEMQLPAGILEFMTWLALNLWLLPLFALLVGATLLALSLALRASEFRFARRLGKASLWLGVVLCVLAPFTGFGPNQPAFVGVAVIFAATGGISVLLVIALIRCGLLLWRTRRRVAVEQPSTAGTGG